jgi:N-carbamoylputrescine amidase
MAPTLSVAATSLTSEMAGPEANLKKAAEVIAIATERGAEVVVFPETYITGYTCGEVEGKFFDLAEPIPGPSTEVLAKHAQNYNVYIAVGLVEANQDYPGLIHNSAVFLGPEGILHVHRKVHLPNFPPFKEITYGFTPGDKFTVFKIKQNWNIGMLICYDASFPEPARVMAINGADLLITLSAGPEGTEKGWTLINQMRGRENTIFYLFSNAVGPQWGNVSFFGGAMIVAPDGEILARGKVGEEDIIVVEIEATALFDRRKTYPVLRDRRPSAYKGIV